MKTSEEINVLISKFLSGEASPQEAIYLEDWKSENPQNEAYYKHCEQLFYGEKIQVNVSESWNNVRAKLKVRETKIRKVNFSWVQIAASLLVLIGLALLWRYLNPSEVSERTFITQNKSRQLRLDDGSSIRLAKNSSLELDVDYNKSNRKIKLKGSAYFSVEHDEKKEFIIDAGAISIKDLGTKFDVRTVKDTVFIRVDEGSVLIYNQKGLKITLEANEQAYYVISQGALKITVENDSYVKRAPIKLIFENQSLKRVVESLNQMYSANIRLESESLGLCRITTQFNDEPLDVVLEIIAQTLDLTVEKKANYYLISGKGC